MHPPAPTQVMDCAQRALADAGFTGSWGADGDHLQTPDDVAAVAAVAAAGFCWFTIDPSNHVHCQADTMTDAQLAARC